MNNVVPSFADRIVNIAITGPLIRIEFATMPPATKDGEQPTASPTQTVVMPLDGFAASYNLLEAAVKHMLDQGMLTRQSVPREGQATPDKSLN